MAIKKNSPVVRLTYLQILRTTPMMNFYGKPRYEMVRNDSADDKDGLFYLMTGLVLMFALIRLIFWKYMENLFDVVFRISLKQKQMREQLIQSPLPSLLLNLFFAIAGGIYISFLLKYYQVDTPFQPWQIMSICIGGLATIYLAKFLLLKLMGWIFNIAEATDTYIFILFLVNKLLGIILIPVVIIMAFSGEPFVSIAIMLSLLVIAIFFVYRYVASYEPVRKEIKVSQIHFLIYLLAFELSPLLLVYKVLLTFIAKST